MKRIFLALILAFLFPIISLASELRTDDVGKQVETVSEDIKSAEYQHEVSFDVSAFYDEKLKPIGYNVPITVHYNDTYNNFHNNGVVAIDDIKLSDDGVLYLSLSAKNISGIIGVNQNYRYVLSDGSVIEGQAPILTMEWQEIDIKYSDTMLRRDKIYDDFKSGNVVSAEIWITEYTKE